MTIAALTLRPPAVPPADSGLVSIPGSAGLPILGHGQHFAGIQIKAVLHRILRRFEWSIHPDYELNWNHTSLPTPSDGLPFELEQTAT